MIKITSRQEEFVAKSESPIFWFMNAEKLKISGDVLYKKYIKDLKNIGIIDIRKLKYLDVANIATFLYALSMENLIKALIIKINGKLIKSHNQIVLIEKTGVKLDQECLNLLTKLSSFGTWTGKYPTPLIYDELFVKYNSTKKNYNSWLSDGKSDILPLNNYEIQVFKKIYSKISKKLNIMEITN